MQSFQTISNHQVITFGNTEYDSFWHFQNTDNQYRYNHKITPNSTGKELDAETGYSYFGARYLDHEPMTLWLSVDPMSDKYPSISPYAYCAWNPVKLVDLEGMDIWELDVSGNIVAHRESSESDAFYIVDETGKKIEGAGLTLPYGTVFSFESVADEALECIIDSYELTGDENGTRLFEFLADNTNIEWSHFQLEEKGENGYNVISSTHLKDCDRSAHRKLKKFKADNCILRVFNHSHPNGIPYPSGTGEDDGDMVLIKWIYENYTTDFTSSIYTPHGSTTKYHPYDVNYERVLQPVVVTAKKNK